MFETKLTQTEGDAECLLDPSIHSETKFCGALNKTREDLYASNQSSKGLTRLAPVRHE